MPKARSAHLASRLPHWKPVYNILEALFTVLVVNAQHIKNVPGRKTDVKLRPEVAFVAVETA